MKSHRERDTVGPSTDARRSAIRLSTRSASTVSSSLTDPSEAQGSSYSEPLTQHSHSSTDSSQNYTEPNDQSCSVQRESLKRHSSGKYELEAINTDELEDILHGCLGKGLGNKQSMDISCASDKKKNTMALNAVSFVLQ